MMRLICLLSLSICVTHTFAQQNDQRPTEKVWRVNFLNPAIEIELPTGASTTFSAGLGVGYGGAYPEISSSGNGILYIIGPFLDIQEKWFYSLNRRESHGKSIDNNSGNFISIRSIIRGPAFAENVDRTSDFDVAIGPTWGLQRKFGERFHFLFDVGPQFYFDTKGNWNIWPLMLQINLGFDLHRK